MNKIVELNGKLACDNCGSLADITDLKCDTCNQTFSETIKVIGKTPTMSIGNFISVEKLKQVGKISIML